MIGRTASSMRGRSRMNCRVLSGRSSDRIIPIFIAALLIHCEEEYRQTEIRLGLSVDKLF